MERSKDDDSIIFTSALPRRGVSIAWIPETQDLPLRAAVRERPAKRVGRRSPGHGEVGDRPAGECLPERIAHAGDVLVPQHAEYRVRLRKESHFAEIVGEHARGL